VKLARFSQCGWELALLACLLLSAQLNAQVADSDVIISTDRPSVAKSSTVVPRGYFQVENGLLVTRSLVLGLKIITTKDTRSHEGNA